MKNQPPRPSVKRPYKSAAALVVVTANGLGSVAAPKAGLRTVVEVDESDVEASVEESVVEEDFLADLDGDSITTAHDAEAVVPFSHILTPQKKKRKITTTLTAVPATPTVYKPVKTSVPAAHQPVNTSLPVDTFATITAEPTFLHWFHDPSSITLPSLQANSFHYVKSHRGVFVVVAGGGLEIQGPGVC
ncbi:unnamed protein product [Zymoseptoria tritici ST99CH_1A5]|uniref:Uncharacterized protein n=1 Tax=Zymoseptoria tritici ST99CH_1A5 TaxID=1276529 RepID=A0A1Y6M4Z6_ZYMTR|nr:unnamed protein product [Zymoseptoria tritici ST99CH_1A5]